MSRDVVVDTMDFYSYRITVKACQMKCDFSIENLGHNEFGLSGDYLCVDDTGRQWIVKKSVFESMYSKVV